MITGNHWDLLFFSDLSADASHPPGGSYDHGSRSFADHGAVFAATGASRLLSVKLYAPVTGVFGTDKWRNICVKMDGEIPVL